MLPWRSQCQRPCVGVVPQRPLARRSRRSLLFLLPLTALLTLPADRVAARNVPEVVDAATVGGGPDLRVLLAQGEQLELTASGGAVVVREGTSSRLNLVPGQRLLLRWQGGSVQGQVLDAVGLSPQTLAFSSTDLWIEPGGRAGGAATSLASREPRALLPAEVGDPRVDPAAAPLLELQRRRFRGRLQVRAQDGQLQAINHVPLETYLASVVGSEMPASWPQAALRAQAVAARTYALSQRRPVASFDVKATVASQMYKGVEAETGSTREAVAATRGQVLLYGNRLIQAVFHSSGGGTTENSGELWNQQLPYLVSVPDYDATSPVSRWEQRYDAASLRRLFPDLGGVSAIEVLATTSSGRVRRAQLRGPAGSVVLSGSELRNRLKLRSTLVQFRFELAPASTAPAAAPLLPGAVEALPLKPMDLSAATAGPTGSTGVPQLPPLPALEPLQPARPTLVAVLEPVLVVSGRGFGHGVGMSQWGAYAMALNGTDYTNILRHYYRGAEVRPYTPR